jgi:membrane associated rhomboid family serine protease
MFPLKDNLPNDRFPLITLVLVAINVVAYLLSLRHGGSLFGGPSDGVVVRYGAIPYEFTHAGKHCALFSVTSLDGSAQTQVLCQGQGVPLPRVLPQPATWVTAFTSMFLHSGPLHLFGNMLFLWVFGANVEDSMGRVRFVLFYLLGGLAALGVQILVHPDSTAPTLGASGAIAAVLGGYIVLYPRGRVLTLIFIVFFFTVIELPAIVLLGLWFATQVYFGASGLTNPIGAGGGIAYFAHVGGFVFGLAAIRLFARRRPPTAAALPVH